MDNPERKRQLKLSVKGEGFYIISTMEYILAENFLQEFFIAGTFLQIMKKSQTLEPAKI